MILMDEPSFGLSPLVKARVFEHIGALREAGVGVLLSEQDAVSAFRLADQAYIFEQGEVVLSGNPDDVRHAPETARAVFA
jgi:branched-chain amino acid transport system ATP-binding protein